MIKNRFSKENSAKNICRPVEKEEMINFAL